MFINLSALPVELLLEIYRHLDALSLAHVSETDRSINTLISQENKLWENQFRHHYPITYQAHRTYRPTLHYTWRVEFNKKITTEIQSWKADLAPADVSFISAVKLGNTATIEKLIATRQMTLTVFNVETDGIPLIEWLNLHGDQHSRGVILDNLVIPQLNNGLFGIELHILLDLYIACRPAQLNETYFEKIPGLIKKLPSYIWEEENTAPAYTRMRIYNLMIGTLCLAIKSQHVMLLEKIIVEPLFHGLINDKTVRETLIKVGNPGIIALFLKAIPNDSTKSNFFFELLNSLMIKQHFSLIAALLDEKFEENKILFNIKNAGFMLLQKAMQKNDMITVHLILKLRPDIFIFSPPNNDFFSVAARGHLQATDLALKHDGFFFDEVQFKKWIEAITTKQAFFFKEVGLKITADILKKVIVNNHALNLNVKLLPTELQSILCFMQALAKIQETEVTIGLWNKDKDKYILDKLKQAQQLSPMIFSQLVKWLNPSDFKTSRQMGLFLKCIIEVTKDPKLLAYFLAPCVESGNYDPLTHEHLILCYQKAKKLFDNKIDKEFCNQKLEQLTAKTLRKSA